MAEILHLLGKGPSKGDSISLTLYSTDVNEHDCYLLHRLLQENSVKLFGLVGGEWCFATVEQR